MTQLGLARYADRGYGLLLLRAGVLFGCARAAVVRRRPRQLWEFVAARALLGASVGMIVPAARRAIVMAADGDLGERLGVFYASYLAGFVFGPPIAGVLTVIADVRLPFLVLGLAGRAEQPGAPRRRRRRAGQPRRTGRPRRPAGDPAPGAPSGAVVAALLVVVSFRYSVGVFEPLWATLPRRPRGRHDARHDLPDRVRPADAASSPSGRGACRTRYGPRLTSVRLGRRDRAADGVVRVRRHGAARDGHVDPARDHGGDPVAGHAGRRRRCRHRHVTPRAAQGLAEAAGSAAAAIGAFTAAPLFDALGAGPAWLIAGAVMAVLLTVSTAPRPPPASCGRPAGGRA